MTDSDIVKVLQHCALGNCRGCPNCYADSNTCNRLLKEAAELILRQKDMIERLQKKVNI